MVAVFPGICTNAVAGQYYTSSGTASDNCSTANCNFIAADEYYTDSGVTAGTTAACNFADCETPSPGKYFTASGTNSNNCELSDCVNLPPFATYQSGFANSTGASADSRTNSIDCAFKCTKNSTGCSAGRTICFFVFRQISRLLCSDNSRSMQWNMR